MNELREWLRTVWPIFITIIGGGVAVYRAVVKLNNVTAASVRAEFKTTQESCVRHSQRLDDHERRLLLAEGEIKANTQEFGEISQQLREIKQSVDGLRASVSDEEKSIAGKLGKIEANQNMLMKQAGLA